MSIATLKKKTQAKYHNNSVNVPHFSLEGGYRNQGYVGQTSLSRSLPRTTAKGTVSKGYGGCCGTFHKFPPVLSSIQSTEKSSVIKHSVINTPGLIATKYRWINRPFPYAVVDKTAQKSNDASDYTVFLRKQTIAVDASCHVPTTQSQKCCYPTKTPEKKITALSQGEYLEKIHIQCAALDATFLRQQRSYSSVPFSCGK